METVDPKVVEEKVSSGKPLNAAETEHFLQGEPPPADFAKGGPVAVDMDSSEMDGDDAPASKPEAKAGQDQGAEGRPAEDKKPDPAKAEKPAEKEDFFVKLETELQKPEGKEDLKAFSDREKAYFHSMRRDRKARQKAEEERDAAIFREIKGKKEAEKPAAPAKVEEPDPISELDKRDPTDFLTVADVKKILDKQKNIPTKKEEAVTPTSIMANPITQNFLRICDEQAAAKFTDYEEVLELAPEIMDTNPAYQQQVAESLIKGENPAFKMYELIKADPEFAKLLPVAQTKVAAKRASKTPVKPKEEPKPAKSQEDLEKERKAAEAQAALEKNASREKTSGHMEGREKLEGSDYSAQEISEMSDRDFAKLPKKTREKYLQMYG